jgi:hypothetical protein
VGGFRGPGSVSGRPLDIVREYRDVRLAGNSFSSFFLTMFQYGKAGKRAIGQSGNRAIGQSGNGHTAVRGRRR